MALTLVSVKLELFIYHLQQYCTFHTKHSVVTTVVKQCPDFCSVLWCRGRTAAEH